MIIIYTIAFVIIWIKNKPAIKLFKRKPFNCELCLTFWILVAYSLIYGIYTIGDAALAALLAPIALNLYNKLWIWSLK